MTDPYYRPFEPLVAASHVIHGRAVVVAPHPDDEIVGCGGVVVAHREAGHEVDVVVMTDGGLGNPSGEGGPEYTALRKEETRRALDLVGGATHHFLDHPDGRLNESWRPVEQLVRILERVQPGGIFFPSPYEVHTDHRATSLQVFRAVRALPSPPRLYCYEVGAMMPANLLVDVTPYMLKKEQALTAFPSQLLHQDLVGKVRALNHARTVNVDDATIRYAEAYIHVAADQAGTFLESVEDLLRITDSMGGGC